MKVYVSVKNNKCAVRICGFAPIFLYKITEGKVEKSAINKSTKRLKRVTLVRWVTKTIPNTTIKQIKLFKNDGVV